MSSVVIVGSGLAAYTLAKELRKLAPDSPLRIITADEGAFYSKPMLSNALAKGKTAQTLATASTAQMAEQLNAAITPHTSVTAIDTTARAVITAGETIPYDKLVLCTGAQQIPPPLEGAGADAVLSVNGHAEYAVFRNAFATATRVGILGPGLICCVFANDLVAAGKQVTVIGPDAAPLGRLMPAAAGLSLQLALEKRAWSGVSA